MTVLTEQVIHDGETAAQSPADSSATTEIPGDDLQNLPDERKPSPRLAAVWQQVQRTTSASPVADIGTNAMRTEIPSGNVSQSQESGGKFWKSAAWQPQPPGRSLTNQNPGNVTDKAWRITSLLRNGRLYYEDLRTTPNGRHLLLVTLLENVDRPLWEPRAMGRIHFYLPLSLR
jgi:hypothetical protein